MSENFYQLLFNSQKSIGAVPPNETIAAWALDLLALLFPERSDKFPVSPEDVGTRMSAAQAALTTILHATAACSNCVHAEKSQQFFDSLPRLYYVLNSDIDAIIEGDPAARNRFEVIRAYPGFYAIAFYRFAHALLKLDIPFVPRILTEHAHSTTGIDIHPAASIGEHFFIDHGTGIVVGETTVIGNHVKLYQGVTLGALSVDKALADVKRHPTVEDHVIIYSGATILGGDTVIGHHSVIGGNVWITNSVAPFSKVYHRAANDVVEQPTNF